VLGGRDPHAPDESRGSLDEILLVGGARHDLQRIRPRSARRRRGPRFAVGGLDARGTRRGMFWSISRALYSCGALRPTSPGESSSRGFEASSIGLVMWSARDGRHSDYLRIEHRGGLRVRHRCPSRRFPQGLSSCQGPMQASGRVSSTIHREWERCALSVALAYSG
jgi:hypothetical protein